ncbi:Cyanohydrin beta-glucosyltransferase [Hordeum vulgare]|nr:Cyanohydrin beta-glucosyltransferase [Hordeum vulgare]
MVIEQDRRIQHNRECRPLITERDVGAMAEWRARHPEDIVTENEFWVSRREERAAQRWEKRRCKALAISQIGNLNTTSDSKDEWWEDAMLLLKDYNNEMEE